jgi:hypothetical protein
MSPETKTIDTTIEQSIIPTQSQIEILGLESKPDYSRQEIKDAYRKMSKILHPDVGGTAKDFFSLCVAYNAILGENYQLSARPTLLESELKYCRRMNLDSNQIRFYQSYQRGVKFVEPPDFVFNPPPIRDPELINLLWKATQKIHRHNNKIFVSSERYHGEFGAGRKEFDNKEFRLGAEKLYKFFGSEDFVANFVEINGEIKKSYQIAFQCEEVIKTYSNMDPAQAIFEKKECEYISVKVDYYSLTWLNKSKKKTGLFKIIPDADPINAQTIQIVASLNEERLYTSHPKYEKIPEIDLFKSWYMLLVRLVDQNLLSKTKTETQMKPLKIIFLDRIITYFY